MNNLKIIKQEEIPGSKYSLKKITFDFKRKDGEWQNQQREVYDRGDGATILIYNPQTKNVILTRQLRIPTFINGNPDGMVIEACAGFLDGDDAETCAKREAEEETGYKINNIRKAFEIYMSPGAITERLFCFVGEYGSDSKVNEGGGLEEEGEDIEVLEIHIDKALGMVDNGEIKDAKTVMLLQFVRLKGIL